MSGDVQPRKRKDKKRKKDEPRGTAAALGEGDVFIHSQHDHGTGGHWCAKIIFFSLLFVLIGLIGLIILENRGLSELEANSVQSQYSGVLEGWLEDAPDDDHHDEHTLELKHHDDHDEAEHSEEAGDDEHDDDHDDDEDRGDDDDDDEDENHDDNDDEGNEEELQEDENDDDQGNQDDDEDQDDNDSAEQGLEDNDEDEDLVYRNYYQEDAAEPDDDDDDDDNADDDNDDDDDLKNEDNDEDELLSNEIEQNDENDDGDDDDLKNEDNDEDELLSNEIEQNDENDDGDDENNQSIEQDDDNDDQDENRDNGESNEQNNEDEEEHEEEEEEDQSLEVEKIEKEAPEDEEPIDVELPALPEEDDDDDDDKDQGSVEDAGQDADDGNDDDDGDDVDNDDNGDDNASEPDDDFLEADDDEPPVERITAPSGKPFDEVEDEPSTEKPTDTLEEEEEYEKRQEQLRKEEAEASHMWLKLSIGGALLVATHAIVRRATASSDVAPSEDAREATPSIDRRMTLIPEEPSEPVPIKKVSQESSRPIPSITRKSPTFEESEEEEEPVTSKVQTIKEEERRELYSDEEEEEEEEEPIIQKKVAPAASKPKEPTRPSKEPTPPSKEATPEEDVPDDVEIIDDEQIEEEEEVDEEEISDVDDEELLTRLEAKYGRLPEPERPARRKDGGNSLEEGWPGEPADAYWRQHLEDAEREFNQGALMAAADRASSAQLKTSARARWIVAKSLDAAAERKRDNALLGRAIAAYLELLKMNERLSDKKLIEIAERTINRIQFRGTYLSAEPVYRLLIRRFPDEPSHRTNLTVMFLMANRGDLAEEVLKETLKRWPNDRLALAQYGFILKTQHNRLEEALHHLQKALEGDTGPATEPRFYYHLGDTLLLLGRFEEAHEVHKRGAAHGHFLSPAQRSLYNVPRLKGRPWWNIEDTPYIKLARDLEKHWKEILKEGEAAKALYEQEKEGLKERGEWSQLDLFVRGREIDGRCARAPVTCAVVRREVAAAGCRRGQIKFSSMRAGTHVRPHVGPTNCRLRMHLGLSNTKDTFIRVHKETRQWQTGKVFMFDDSFEHEVWHNGTGSRLVLIVDVWHPELTAAERRQLPAI
ncbi:aspartyl/asparaginyl beta-hydroxylase isoform X3 [Leguminivora glycinivorella]|uniref:aspartyl/asparaginyl beta-hydroxylase isoform X3 n=1 Tax=Leguminivora glycinivorella TaxID=1035111 RepID=UPI00200F9E3B|nr:aspartyl/asparaginyl beta-hydroxylase isoform X3 [Leguminivora glycinivorella]XP_047985364.1 aspartyl/asparaginyl beta-hydroxylase isoform X3 [Leguminivora glycinivorella]